jgi:hypothetical protein
MNAHRFLNLRVVTVGHTINAVDAVGLQNRMPAIGPPHMLNLMHAISCRSSISASDLDSRNSSA